MAALNVADLTAPQHPSTISIVALPVQHSLCLPTPYLCYAARTQSTTLPSRSLTASWTLSRIIPRRGRSGRCDGKSHGTNSSCSNLIGHDALGNMSTRLMAKGMVQTCSDLWATPCYVVQAEHDRRIAALEAEEKAKGKPGAPPGKGFAPKSGDV